MQPQVITKVSISALVISLPILYVSLLRLPPSTLARDSTFWFLMSNSIMVIIAADSGVLFFGSTSEEDSCRSDVHDESGDTLPVPFMSLDEPAMLIISHVVMGEQLRQDVVAGCKATNTNAEGHAFASVVGGEEDAAGKQSTGENCAIIVKGEQEESEPNKLLVEDQVLATPPNASEDGDDELVIINSDGAFAQTEPVASKSLVEDKTEDDQCSPISRTTPEFDDVDASTVVAKEGKHLRSAAEECEYWQLSDEELNRKVEEFITRFNRDMRLQIEQEAGV